MLSDKPYAELLHLEPAQYTSLQNLDFMGDLIDFSYIKKDIAGTKKAFEIVEAIRQTDLLAVDQARLHYFQANAWSNMRFFNRFEQPDSWDYDQTELTKEIFHLRSCLRMEGFAEMQKERQCQIFTNLGNHFSHVGRFIEAQHMWHNALAIIPRFPMALGNIGQGYFHYAGCLYDDNHRSIFIYHTYDYLKRALLLKKHLDPSAFNHWNELAGKIAANWPASFLQVDHDFNQFDLGENGDLKDYREWCLGQSLYINPLNDLGPYTIACHDILHLPAMTVANGEPPKYHTLFNQIKQEYGTARFLYYEGTQLAVQHYADHDIQLVDTLEYAEYSYNLEKVKIAYRLIYSLFDKIAYLLNDYLQLDLKRSAVSFRALWHETIKGKRILRNRFRNNNNLALRGLYWLSKDLFNADEEQAHSEVLEPGAQELAAIRNHIEHKSFKVVQYGTWGADDEDNYTYSIDRGKFEFKTIKLMGLIRSAIIYTSLAIHHEEIQNPKGSAFPMELPDFPFDDKV